MKCLVAVALVFGFAFSAGAVLVAPLYGSVGSHGGGGGHASSGGGGAHASSGFHGGFSPSSGGSGARGLSGLSGGYRAAAPNRFAGAPRYGGNPSYGVYRGLPTQGMHNAAPRPLYMSGNSGGNSRIGEERRSPVRPPHQPGNGPGNGPHRPPYRPGYGNGYGYGYAGVYGVSPWLFGYGGYGDLTGSDFPYYPDGDGSDSGAYAGGTPDQGSGYQGYDDQGGGPAETYPAPNPEEQPAYRQPMHSAPAFAEPAAVTLVFKDGRPSEQIHNYLLTRKMLSVLDKRQQDIPVDELDLAATEKVNRAAGVVFRLPGDVR